MKKIPLMASALVAAATAFGGIWFKGDATTKQGYWDDLNCWWTWYNYANHATSLTSIDDVNIPYGHTVVVTGTTANCWSLKAFSNDASHPATVRIVSGGTLNVTRGGDEEFGTRHSAYSDAYKYGCLDIQSGATNSGSIVVGGTGHGIVTNAGCNSFGNMKIGRDAGSSGIYVHAGGYNKLDNPKDLDVGINGDGKLLVQSGTFGFKWYANGNNIIGYTRIGCGSGGGTGLVQVEDGARFEAGLPYLGGNATTVGDGRVRLRGGTFKVLSDFGNSRGIDSMWIGAATDGTGLVRGDTYGQISGWGVVAGNSAGNANSIHARLGNGVILADGEGVERTLDCSDVWQVTNVLFGAESSRTNGWYAVNKGAVIMPGVNVVLDNGGDNWGFREGANAVGCCRGLRKPNLVNAVYMNVRVPWKAAGKNLGVMLLASDRSDAHADALEERYMPLGFWKAGVFDNRTGFSAATRQDIQWAELDFRYDQNKVQNTENALAVLRWSETDHKWTRLARYDEQPADFIVSTGRFTDPSDDPVWGIGLFCVAEMKPTGFKLIVR
jgi:hypothetical protein